MRRLSAQKLDWLRAHRARDFQASATAHRAADGRQTGDARLWPVDHTEAGLLKRSRDTVLDADGRLVAQSTPIWVTTVDTQTQPGDLLAIDGRWYTVTSPPRAQTYQTAAEFALTEVVYGS